MGIRSVAQATAVNPYYKKTYKICDKRQYHTVNRLTPGANSLIFSVFGRRWLCHSHSQMLAKSYFFDSLYMQNGNKKMEEHTRSQDNTAATWLLRRQVNNQHCGADNCSCCARVRLSMVGLAVCNTYTLSICVIRAKCSQSAPNPFGEQNWEEQKQIVINCRTFSIYFVFTSTLDPSGL